VEKKIIEFFVIAGWVVLSLWAVQQVIKGGFMDMLSLAPVLALLGMIVFNNLRKYWFGIIIGIQYVNVPVHIPLAETILQPKMLCSMMALVLLFMQHLMTRRVWNDSSPVFKMMLVVASIITLRFAVDPPGTARMGAETGGIRTALDVLLGGWLFFIGVPVLQMAAGLKKQHQIITVLAAVAVLQVFITTRLQFEYVYFHRQMWLLGACILPLVLERCCREAPKAFPVKFFLWACLFLVLGVLARHRTRPLYALLMIAAAAFSYRRSMKVLPLIGICGVLAVGTVIAINPDILPTGARRALSTFISTDIYSSVDAKIGETGVESDFRKEMYRKGFEAVAKNPVWGKGFGFNTAEVVASLAESTSNMDFNRQAVIGAYHNSLLMLASQCGVIPPILYIIVFFAINIRYVRWMRGLPYGELKVMVTTLFVYLLPATGQLLLNGGTGDIYYVTTILGMQYALLKVYGQSGGVKRFAVPVRRNACVRQEGA
jgi:hypothetical protein